MFWLLPNTNVYFVYVFRINKKKVQAFIDPKFKVTPDMLAQYNV